MRIAYLAPELPALSATFVYNEILQLEKLGDSVVPFSVRRPASIAEGPALAALQNSVVVIYEQKTLRVVQDHLHLLAKRAAGYTKAVGYLINDIFTVGMFTRNTAGLVYRFFYSANVARALIEQKCRHVHAHFAHVPADIAMYASAMAGISFSATAHANDIFERGWLLAEKVDRSAFLATISEFNKKFLVDSGVKADKVRIIRCGINFGAFSRKHDSNLGRTIKIGVVGRLVEKKGIDTLIRATARLKQQKVGFQLLIAGSGPLAAAWHSLAEELTLTGEDVRFLGAMPHEKVSDFIKSLDVFALPCRAGLRQAATWTASRWL